MHKHRNLLAHAPQRLHEEITADYKDMINIRSPAIHLIATPQIQDMRRPSTAPAVVTELMSWRAFRGRPLVAEASDGDDVEVQALGRIAAD